MFRKILQSRLPEPPIRSRQGFWVEKIVIALISVLWICGAVVLYMKWAVLPFWVKLALTVFEVFVTIDIASAKRIFQTYDEYLREKR